MSEMIVGRSRVAENVWRHHPLIDLASSGRCVNHFAERRGRDIEERRRRRQFSDCQQQGLRQPLALRGVEDDAVVVDPGLGRHALFAREQK